MLLFYAKTFIRRVEQAIISTISTETYEKNSEKTVTFRIFMLFFLIFEAKTHSKFSKSRRTKVVSNK
jgi:hypothetical protein